ncbi:MAG: Ig-like domain-containing protein [Gemmatimonadales bacterium]
MRQLTRICYALSAFALLSVQLSCGSDASGPDSKAAAIAAYSSTTLTAAPGAAVIEPPSVLVSDASGAPLAGAHVTFVVTGGGGTLSGGSATTDASGIATVGSWTLGANPGTNTLVARIGSLPVVTFTASGSNPCDNIPVHTLGTSTNGQLLATDCRLSDGSFVDFYAVNLPAVGTYIFTQTSSEFDSYIALLAQSGALVGVNDDSSATNRSSLLKVIVTAGNYTIAANSYLPNEVGHYTLASAASGAEVTNCEDVFVVIGITSPQSLQTTDCNDGGLGSYSDDYVIFVAAGQKLTVTMSSSTVDSFLEIHADGSGIPAASNDDIDFTTKDARIVFTAPTTPQAGAFYVVKARSTAAGVTGAYTLTLQ